MIGRGTWSGINGRIGSLSTDPLLGRRLIGVRRRVKW